MRVDEIAVQKAFDHYLRHYVGQKGWGIKERVDLWERACKAFGQSSAADFHELYQRLRGSWQVFRGSSNYWSEPETFDVLRNCDRQFAQYKLSSFGEHDRSAVWGFIKNVEGIKTNKTGPSVVAVSKFLHFWNPRLFVIVDDSVVWKCVFGHEWLREQVQLTRTQLETDCLIHDVREHDNEVCDLPTYFAVLVWASQLVQKNPCIVRGFDKYIRQHAAIPVPGEVAEYEAAAVEWFLLGLVELPPAGVTIEECDVPPKEH